MGSLDCYICNSIYLSTSFYYHRAKRQSVTTDMYDRFRPFWGYTAQLYMSNHVVLQLFINNLLIPKHLIKNELV